MRHLATRERVGSFCARFGLRIPVLLAPMSGACPPSLSIAVANAGGLGSCGALLMDPGAIDRWASEFRTASNGPFQLNLWIPDPVPERDPAREAAVARFLGGWGPPVPDGAGDATPPGLLPPVRSLARRGAADRLLRDGPLPSPLRRTLEGARHRVVCKCFHGRGGRPGRKSRGGCRRRPRHGGGRPQGSVFRFGGRGRDGGPGCVGPGRRGCRPRARRGDRRDRRRAGE